MFRDEVVIDVASGSGGAGCVSFLRERYRPRGGPDGGDGGRGGDVILIASRDVSTLYHLEGRGRLAAEDGRPGGGASCSGRGGEDLEVRVPVGTLVRDADRGNLLKDLASDGERVRVCKGGRGGRGNARFATSVDQAPRRAEPGEPGEQRHLLLELKLIADVGLVGLPNAGKSTLLAALSAARPRIGDYPFTTLVPMLGIVDAGDFRSFVVADLPGLVEGAHEGTGLGDRFLKHIERTRVLVHVVDAAPIDGSDPVESYQTIRRELELHPAGLEHRPEIVVANKLDVLGADLRRSEGLGEEASEVVARLAEAAGGALVLPISAATRGGLGRLIQEIAELLERLPEG
jgi:GTP-binding protein